MGYEFICGIPMAVGTACVIIFGLFIMLEKVENWAAGKPFFEIMKIFFTRLHTTNQQANRQT